MRMCNCSPCDFFYCSSEVYSDYKKERIIYLYNQGFKPPTIKKLIAQEGMHATREGIHKFLVKFNETGCLVRRPGSGHPSKMTLEIKNLVEQQMRLDDETTAYQLHKLLVSSGLELSLQTILRCRASLGWTFRGSSYCQLIREPNKLKRLEWAKEHQQDELDNVIYSDECTVQLETHRRFCCRKRGKAPRPKPRYLLIIIYI